MATLEVQLARRAGQQARMAEAISQTFARELAQVVREAEREIRRLIRTLAAAEDGRLIAERAQLARALAMRGDLVALLERAGWSALVRRATGRPLERLAEVVLGRSVARFPVQVVSAVRGLQRLRLDELLTVELDAAVALWRATVSGVLGARRAVDLVDDLAAQLDLSARQVRTLYDTSVSIYSRQVEQLITTGERDERFLYAGPDDLKTRPFCEARVGQVYTREEIDRMENGQLPNVLLTGGGYNCRHAWKRMSIFEGAAA